jgi:superfamily II DNA/RNA helicase
MPMSDDGASQLTCASFNRVQAFRDGDVRFLICTDVAARGKLSLHFNNVIH